MNDIDIKTLPQVRASGFILRLWFVGDVRFF